MRKLWVRAGLAALVALAAVVGAECQQAGAQQTVPFEIKGSGVVEFVPFTTTPPTNRAAHVTTGTATLIGNHTARGIVQLLTLPDPMTGKATFASAVPTVFRGQNGTLLYWYGRVDKGAPAPGVVQLSPAAGGKFIATWDAIFTLAAPAKHVSGSTFRMIAVTDPFVLGSRTPVPYRWEGEGTITFRR